MGLMAVRSWWRTQRKSCWWCCDTAGQFVWSTVIYLENCRFYQCLIPTAIWPHPVAIKAGKVSPFQDISRNRSMRAFERYQFHFNSMLLRIASDLESAVSATRRHADVWIATVIKKVTKCSIVERSLEPCWIGKRLRNTDRFLQLGPGKQSSSSWRSCHHSEVHHPNQPAAVSRVYVQYQQALYSVAHWNKPQMVVYWNLWRLPCAVTEIGHCLREVQFAPRKLQNVCWNVNIRVFGIRFRGRLVARKAYNLYVHSLSSDLKSCNAHAHIS